MQIPIKSGLYTDASGNFREKLPRNLMPVADDLGISQGYLRPGYGITSFALGSGSMNIDRGGINWEGNCYRAMGPELVRVESSGAITTLGTIGGASPVTFDYSFDRLAVASDGKLFYWDGSTLTQVTDPDLRNVVDMVWVDGYFFTTDGENLVVTELLNPLSVNLPKYGSSEADSDPVVALLKIRNEVVALNRHTIEIFDNIGGALFPFARIEGAQIMRGCLGTHACCEMDGAIVFLGSAKNEPPAVYVGSGGESQEISTPEINRRIRQYSEAELSDTIVEKRFDSVYKHLLVHLPNETLAHDVKASGAYGSPVWFTLDSGSLSGPSQYRARYHVWCYDKWLVGDPTERNIGTLTETTSTHWDERRIGWEFGTPVVYNESRRALVHELELVALTGNIDVANLDPGVEPTIATSYSLDGRTWSQEESIAAGTDGERDQRLIWLGQGPLENWRLQRFRGTSESHLTIARLEARIEPLGE